MTAAAVRPTGLVAHAEAALAAVLEGLPLLRALLDDEAAASVAGKSGREGGRDLLPADRRLADYFRKHPNLGRRDRRWLADRIFDVLRNARLYAAWVRQAGPGRTASVPAVRAVTAADLLTVAVAGAEGPVAGLDEFARQAPPPIRFSLPDWLWQGLQAEHPDEAAAIAAALLSVADIDLRCNLLRTRVPALQARLAEEGIAARPVAAPPLAGAPWSALPSTALRVTGRPSLESLASFQDGWFEVQDAGSQWVADACEAKRNEVIIDFCAGAGGKSLALAARMRNTGRVLAFDNGAERLARLAPRAARAGAAHLSSMVLTGLDDARLARYQGKADCVLVDAPCGGSGTLRRNPDLKWRYGPQDISFLNAQQRSILLAAARLVRPGGRLVYATCSLLRAENSDIVNAFEHDWRRSGDSRLLVPTASASLLPGQGSDGFFVAKWIVGTR